jgi:hypothetical protein
MPKKYFYHIFVLLLHKKRDIFMSNNIWYQLVMKSLEMKMAWLTTILTLRYIFKCIINHKVIPCQLTYNLNFGWTILLKFGALKKKTSNRFIFSSVKEYLKLEPER